MTTKYYGRLIAIMAVILTLLSGCLSRSQPTRFYLLRSVIGSPIGKLTPGKEGLKIGVGPVVLPDYLDRPQIVTRISDSELRIDDFNHWGENLTYNVNRVLAKNLSLLLSTDNVFIFPWLGSTQVDYQVKVDIIQFNAVPDGKVILDTQWTVLDGKNRVLKRDISHFIRPAGAKDYEKLAISMSKLLEDLSCKIAEAIMVLQERDGMKNTLE